MYNCILTEFIDRINTYKTVLLAIQRLNIEFVVQSLEYQNNSLFLVVCVILPIIIKIYHSGDINNRDNIVETKASTYTASIINNKRGKKIQTILMTLECLRNKVSKEN